MIYLFLVFALIGFIMMGVAILAERDENDLY